MSATRIAVFLMFVCAAAQAQNYPTRPIRIATGSVNSNGDLTSRLLAQAVGPSLGQPLVVENHSSGVIQAEAVAKAPPDGLTLLVAGSAFWLLPFLERSISWDPIRDFEPISLLSTSPNLSVVHPSVPVKNVKELIALAKTRPGELNYASGSLGSPPHLAAELFNVMAQTNIVRVNYNGAGPAITDLIGGQVQVMFAPAGGVAPHIKSGRLRALAVTSAKPTPLFPDLPTVSASGLPGYESEVLTGMFAAAKTPPPIIRRLNQEMARAMQRPDIREKLFNTGVEAIGSGPDQLTAAVKREVTVWGKLIRDQGIRNE